MIIPNYELYDSLKIAAVEVAHGGLIKIFKTGHNVTLTGNKKVIQRFILVSFNIKCIINRCYMKWVFYQPCSHSSLSYWVILIISLISEMNWLLIVELSYFNDSKIVMTNDKMSWRLVTKINFYLKSDNCNINWQLLNFRELLVFYIN